jgi:hypothetical protein
MFDNIGSKLKSIAHWYTVIGMILVVILAFIMLGSLGFLALIYGVIGCLSVWVSGAVIYGIGQAVENTDILRKKLAAETLEPEAPVYQPVSKREPWACVSCGMENMGHIPYCNGCGTSREWSNAKKEENSQ